MCSFRAGKKGISKRVTVGTGGKEEGEKRTKGNRTRMKGVNKGTNKKHKVEVMGRESRWERKETVTPVNEERQRATSRSQKMTMKCGLHV